MSRWDVTVSAGRVVADAHRLGLAIGILTAVARRVDVADAVKLVEAIELLEENLEPFSD